MPRTANEENPRLQLRVAPEAKAKLVRAAAILQTDLTHFVMQSAVREAETVIAADEVARISSRDYERILELLDDPPVPNGRLRSAIDALPDSL